MTFSHDAGHFKIQSLPLIKVSLNSRTDFDDSNEWTGCRDGASRVILPNFTLSRWCFACVPQVDRLFWLHPLRIAEYGQIDVYRGLSGYVENEDGIQC